jgi:signal transduction histidine kinase
MQTTEDAHQLLEAERAARAKAERTLQMKDELLLHVSHELRTPLSAVLGWSQLLRRETSGATLSEGLQAIEQNARAQLRIIDELLDAGRMMTGKVPLNLRPLRLASVVAVLAIG